MIVKSFSRKYQPPGNSASAKPYKSYQCGMALVTGLLLLTMLTLIALAMFKGFGVQQKIAGNTREKERSFQAAQNALQYGEWWLINGATNNPTGGTCSGTITVTSASDVVICQNTLPTPNDPSSWPGMMNYTPPPMIVSSPGTAGGTTTDAYGNSDINYYKVPGLYINYISLSPAGQKLYQVTAVGYGGSSATNTVVQSVYAVSNSVKNGGGHDE